MIESRDIYLKSAKLDDNPLKEGDKLDDKAFKEALRENFTQILGKNFPSELLELAQLALEVSFDKTAKNFNFQKAEVAKSIEKTLKWQKDFLK